jgi:hypothetical protein
MIKPFAAFGAFALVLALFVIAAHWGWLGKKAQFFMHGFHSLALTTIAPTSTPAPLSVKDQLSGAGGTLPKMKQALKAEAPGAPKKDTGSFDASSSSVKKNIQTDDHASLLQNPKRIIVKDGDTLHDIAYRYFPENAEEGLKKILKVNPKVDDMNLIYRGQILIIPENDSTRKD